MRVTERIGTAASNTMVLSFGIAVIHERVLERNACACLYSQNRLLLKLCFVRGHDLCDELLIRTVVWRHQVKHMRGFPDKRAIPAAPLTFCLRHGQALWEPGRDNSFQEPRPLLARDYP